MAESPDGASWRKLGPLFSPEGWEGNYIAANGTTLLWQGHLHHWYQAGDPPRIALATSEDAGTWVKRKDAVVPLGPRGSFDETGVGDPYVIERAGQLYLYYLGQDRARRQRLGVARSSDGVVWEKLRSNPVLELGADGAFDEAGLGEPAVWTSGGSYWMLYTGRDRMERRRMGLAKSPDGVHWAREASLLPVEGRQDWNRQVLCDPTVELANDGTVRVWFGGGDVAHPVENIHGQIGVGLLRGSVR